MEHLLDTETAAAWLTAHGVTRSPKTLRKLRCTGGGPRYWALNNKPYYTEADLVAWIEERLSGPMSSTSDMMTTAVLVVVVLLLRLFPVGVIA